MSHDCCPAGAAGAAGVVPVAPAVVVGATVVPKATAVVAGGELTAGPAVMVRGSLSPANERAGPNDVATGGGGAAGEAMGVGAREICRGGPEIDDRGPGAETRPEMLVCPVTGDWVTGDWVTGDRVTGDRVTGDRVTGDRVTGD